MANTFGSRYWVKTEDTIFRLVKPGRTWSVTPITLDNLSICWGQSPSMHWKNRLRVTQKSRGKTRTLSYRACSRKSVLGDFFFIMQIWTISKMHKKDDQTSKINHFCLSCSQTLLGRCGQAASLTGKELVWSLFKKPPLPGRLLRKRAVLVTPDSVTSLRVRSIWIASMQTKNGKLKDSLPNFSELERGGVYRADRHASLFSSRAALSGFSRNSGWQ